MGKDFGSATSAFPKDASAGGLLPPSVAKPRHSPPINCMCCCTRAILRAPRRRPTGDRSFLLEAARLTHLGLRGGSLLHHRIVAGASDSAATPQARLVVMNKPE